MPDLTTATLQTAIARIAPALEAAADELNAADAKLGDGDLGVTMQRGARGLVEAADDLPDDLGMALLKCAQAFTKVSGSSYGTLLATGLMSAAKTCKGRESVPWSDLSGLIGGAIAAMQARGKAELGDKTVLDPLDALRQVTEDLSDPTEIGATARTAVAQALDDFRDKQAKQGRARMFGEKSAGLDDPGMLALRVMVEALDSQG